MIAITRILASDLGKTHAGQEFKILVSHLDDIGTFYLECMHCIRKHACNNTLQTFNDVAKYIKASVFAGKNRIQDK